MGGTNRSQLFTVRIWAEEPVPGTHEYRGEVTHVMSGARTPFRDWHSLEAFLVERIETHAGERPAPPSTTTDGGGAR